MRARFSAYVKGEIDYIVDTTHPDNPAMEGSKRKGQVVTTLRQDAQATHEKVRWLRLKVLSRQSGPGSHEDEAFVAFQTWFKFKDQQGQRQRGTRTETMRERSRFLRDAFTQRWLYVDGESDWEAHKYFKTEDQS